MNIIFFTMVRMTDLGQRNIYTDLMRKFSAMGHSVCVVSPRERSMGIASGLTESGGVRILGVRTLNLQKTSIIEKGIGQLLVEYQFRNAFRKFLSGEQFDLILYSTPPVTFPKVIKYVRRCNPGARTYLLLKDIFPQNAVDIGLMTKNGLKGLLYRYFRRKEKLLYSLSDNIGCMSPANVKYLLKENPSIEVEKVGIAPNSVELSDKEAVDRVYVRRKYDIPIDKPIFVYGGNLGKPQGIPFLIECLKANSKRDDCHFLVVGSGTELPKLKAWYDEAKPQSVTLMDILPADEYDKLVRVCDVGLIFLDHRFTIPNYPSRLLPYLENKMPVLCATDPNTDIGRIAEQNGYGYWCESNSAEAFTALVDRMLRSDKKAMGERGYVFLCKNYLVENTYDAVMKHFEDS